VGFSEEREAGCQGLERGDLAGEEGGEKGEMLREGKIFVKVVGRMSEAV